MGWFKKEEEDFDDSTAFESDKGNIIKIFLGVIILIVIVGVIGFIGYNQYENWRGNKTNSNQTNQTLFDINSSPEETIVVNFTNFSLNVKKNPTGIYYYNTQDRVIEEKCYINKIKKNCNALTNSVCAEKECTKELEIITECFVNSEKIDCPE